MQCQVYARGGGMWAGMGGRGPAKGMAQFNVFSVSSASGWRMTVST